MSVGDIYCERVEYILRVWEIYIMSGRDIYCEWVRYILRVGEIYIMNGWDILHEGGTGTPFCHNLNHYLRLC